MDERSVACVRSLVQKTLLRSHNWIAKRKFGFCGNGLNDRIQVLIPYINCGVSETNANLYREYCETMDSQRYDLNDRQKLFVES